MRGIVVLLGALALLGCDEDRGVAGSGGGSVNTGRDLAESGGMSLPHNLPWVICGGYIEREVIIEGETYILEEPVDCNEHIEPGDDVMGGWSSPFESVVR